MRKNPTTSSNPAAPSAPMTVSSIAKPPGVKIIAKEIQKPPYDESAVAPKVLPTAISLYSLG